jgi:hypothetical protein
METVRIVGVSGSLRKAPFGTDIARVLAEKRPR